MLRSSIEQEKTEEEGSKIPYWEPPKEESIPYLIAESEKKSYFLNEGDSNSIPFLSTPSAEILILPSKLQGEQGTYEILSEITVETAKALQAQTGLVVTFEPGRDTATFIGNCGHFGQLRLGKEINTGQFFGIKQIIEPSKVKESLEEAAIQRKLKGRSNWSLQRLVQFINW